MTLIDGFNQACDIMERNGDRNVSKMEESLYANDYLDQNTQQTRVNAFRYSQ